MPRKPYFDQRRFNKGWSQNKSLNRYRWARAFYGKRLDHRYLAKGMFSPDYIEGTWFVVRNLSKEPLLNRGKKF